MRGNLYMGILSVVALMAAPAVSQAAFIALDRVTTTAGTQSGFTLGTVFEVLTPITVTGLGVFDSGSDGLAGTLNAEIFQITGFQVGSIVIGPVAINQGNSTASPLGAYRTVNISPVILNPGVYQIAADTFSTNDPNGNGHGSPTQDTGGGLISFTGSFGALGYGSGGDYFVSGNGNLPVAPGGAGLWLAGTFLFTAVPEPTSLSLLGLGILGLARRRR